MCRGQKQQMLYVLLSFTKRLATLMSKCIRNYGNYLIISVENSGFLGEKTNKLNQFSLNSAKYCKIAILIDLYDSVHYV